MSPGWLKALRRRVAERLPARWVNAYRMARHVHLVPFEPELQVLPRFLDREAVAIDIGANVGIYAQLLARGSKRVIAFEPHPGCADFLRRLALDRVEVVQAAMSATDGEAILRIPFGDADDASALSSLSSTNTFGGVDEQLVRRERVKTMTLDQVGDQVLAHGDRVAFVKIDVEGHEADVLAGGRRVLAAQRPTLLVETEYRHGGDPRAVFRLLAELNYDALALDDGTLKPIDPEQLAARQTSELLQAGRHGGYLNNVFFVPRATSRH
jgi:FkbM family methyltransferase